MAPPASRSRLLGVIGDLRAVKSS